MLDQYSVPSQSALGSAPDIQTCQELPGDIIYAESYSGRGNCFGECLMTMSSLKDGWERMWLILVTARVRDPNESTRYAASAEIEVTADPFFGRKPCSSDDLDLLQPTLWTVINQIFIAWTAPQIMCSFIQLATIQREVMENQAAYLCFMIRWWVGVFPRVTWQKEHIFWEVNLAAEENIPVETRPTVRRIYKVTAVCVIVKNTPMICRFSRG